MEPSFLSCLEVQTAGGSGTTLTWASFPAFAAHKGACRKLGDFAAPVSSSDELGKHRYWTNGIDKQWLVTFLLDKDHNLIISSAQRCDKQAPEAEDIAGWTARQFYSALIIYIN